MPNTLALPDTEGSHLIGAMQTLMAGHTFTADVHQPKLHLQGGGDYTFNIDQAHMILSLTPIDSTDPTLSKYRTILLHPDGPYDPPTITNRDNSTTTLNPATLRRPNLRTPSVRKVRNVS